MYYDSFFITFCLEFLTPFSSWEGRYPKISTPLSASHALNGLRIHNCICNRHDQLTRLSIVHVCTGWPIENAPSIEGYHFRKVIDKHLRLWTPVEQSILRQPKYDSFQSTERFKIMPKFVNARKFFFFFLHRKTWLPHAFVASHITWK